jgi:signal peptidase I
MTFRAHVRRLAVHLWKEWLRPLALLLLVVAPLRSAVVDWNWVPTGSMKPTIVEGDLVLVNKLAYDLRLPFSQIRLANWGNPERGDVVVCFSPADGARLVKRVIGLPGDRVDMRNGRLSINGEPLQYRSVDPAPFRRDVFEASEMVVATEQLGTDDHWVMFFPAWPSSRDFGPHHVPDGCYFLMGDSRDNSHDSRYFGPVRREQIVGEANRVLVSFDLQRWLQPRFQRFGRAIGGSE